LHALQRRQRAHPGVQRGRRKGLASRQWRQLAQHLFQALGAAQAAAGASGEAAAALLEAHEVACGDVDLQGDAGRRFLALDAEDVAAPLTTMPSDRLKPTAKSSRSAGVASITAWLMPLYSKATGVSTASWSPRDSPSRQTSTLLDGLHAPIDRETCTAVTLYSGQLVAQSEFSVVITLAPDSGKWKVV
jgi:hypothetical protein